MNLVILTCKSGFANRVFPLLSSYIYCKSLNIDLAVIWEDDTCRHGKYINIDASNYMDINSYFSKVPKLLKSFRDIEQVYSHYNIKKRDVFQLDMKYRNDINVDLKQKNIIHIFNVCHIFDLSKIWRTQDLRPYPNRQIQNQYISKLTTAFQDFHISNIIFF